MSPNVAFSTEEIIESTYISKEILSNQNIYIFAENDTDDEYHTYDIDAEDEFIVRTELPIDDITDEKYDDEEAAYLMSSYHNGIEESVEVAKPIKVDLVKVDPVKVDLIPIGNYNTKYYHLLNLLPNV